MMSHPRIMVLAIRLACIVGILCSTPALTGNTEEAPYGVRALPGGFVEGDVVSHAYVPIRRWSPEEARGLLPYLCEYELMAWSGDKPLSAFHEENVRRIDLASQWSTAIMFYARRADFRDEIINLMLRAYQHRQLFILRDYWKPGDPQAPFGNAVDILETLWRKRDQALTNPEGDQATGRQLINNILMVKAGDEGFAALRTNGLGEVYRTFRKRVSERVVDGARPFAHIRAWYNLVGWAAWDYGSSWASSARDETEHGRSRLPANTECIGVDTYDYWWLEIGFDPADPANAPKVCARVDEWHDIRTRYYPAGIETKVGKNAHDPATWTPEYWSDTHALMNALQLAKADRAMMIYIGLSSSLPGTYTTPIQTMDRYYDNCKAGPWAGLIWWTSVGEKHPEAFPDGSLGYVDGSLRHYTPEHPKGRPYTDEALVQWRRDFLASRKRMFNDVVHGQFGFLNGHAPE